MVFKAHGRWIHLSILFFSFLVLYMIVGTYIQIDSIKKTFLSTVSAFILLFYAFVCLLPVKTPQTQTCIYKCTCGVQTLLMQRMRIQEISDRLKFLTFVDLAFTPQSTVATHSDGSFYFSSFFSLLLYARDITT